MNIGDKLKCSNGHTYTLNKGDMFYTFSLIDETGEEITLYNEYPLEDCLPYHEEDAQRLCIGKDDFGCLELTQVIEYIEN